MRFLNLRTTFAFYLLFIFSSCTPTVYKVYDGDLRALNDVAFVWTARGSSISSVNGKMFTTSVPGVTVGRQYIELAAPQTYTFTVWNNHFPITPKKSKIFELEVKAGKIYYIIGNGYKNSKYGPFFDASIMVLVDQNSINKFYKRLADGSLKRQSLEPSIPK